MRDDPLLIGGPGHSGTSLVTRMLRDCGAFFGNDGGGPYYTESRIFRFVLYRLMDFCHAHTDWPLGIIDGWKNVQPRQLCQWYVQHKIDQNGLWEEFGDPGEDAWGFKHPLIECLWPFFHDAFPNMRLLLIERGVQATARSYMRDKQGAWDLIQSLDDVSGIFERGIPLMGHTTRTFTIEGCLAMLEDRLKVSKFMLHDDSTPKLGPRLHCLRLEELVSDPETILAPILEDLGLDYNPVVEAYIDKDRVLHVVEETG